MRVKLSDITKYSKGTQINGDSLLNEGKYIYLNGGVNPSGRWNSSNVNENTVTISEGGNSSGYVNYIEEPFWCGAHCYYLFDGPRNTKYLYYALKSQQERLFRIRSGACMPNLKKADLGNFVFEYEPNEKNQAEIVSVLSCAEHIIDIKKRELELLDDLIKARFVELFGNPLDGTARYPLHQVGDVAESVDPQPSHRTPPIDENGVPYVSIKDCDANTGIIDFDGARKVSRKVLEEHLNRYTLHEGDFIIGKIGTIGNPIFVPARNDYTLSANVVLIQPDNKLVSPYFLKYSFESDFVERQFLEAKNSTSQAAFGIQKVRTVEVMNPDIEVQRKFELFVKQVDKSKVAVQKSLDETQILFDSLMQEYFG